MIERYYFINNKRVAKVLYVNGGFVTYMLFEKFSKEIFSVKTSPKEEFIYPEFDRLKCEDKVWIEEIENAGEPELFVSEALLRYNVKDGYIRHFIANIVTDKYGADNLWEAGKNMEKEIFQNKEVQDVISSQDYQNGTLYFCEILNKRKMLN